MTASASEARRSVRPGSRGEHGASCASTAFACVLLAPAVKPPLAEQPPLVALPPPAVLPPLAVLAPPLAPLLGAALEPVQLSVGPGSRPHGRACASPF